MSTKHTMDPGRALFEAEFLAADPWRMDRHLDRALVEPSRYWATWVQKEWEEWQHKRAAIAAATGEQT